MNALIDLAAGTMASSAPFDLKTAEGTIHANAISVDSRGKRVVISNRVSVTYLPTDDLVTTDGLPAKDAPAQ